MFCNIALQIGLQVYSFLLMVYYTQNHAYQIFNFFDKHHPKPNITKNTPPGSNAADRRHAC